MYYLKIEKFKRSLDIYRKCVASLLVMKMKALTSKVKLFLRLEADVLYLAVAMSMLTFAVGLISAFVMVRLRDLGASFLLVGIVASGYNLALALASFFGGSLSTKFGGKKIFVCSLILTLLATISYGATLMLANWLLVALGLLLAQVAWGLRDTSSFSIVAASAEETKKATAFGLLSTLSSIGAIVGPLAGGILVSSFGMKLPFLMAIPVTATAMILISWKLEKGEITSKRVVPAWYEIKEVFTVERGVAVLIVIAFWAQFFAEFGNPYRFVYMKEELGAPDYLLPLPLVAVSISSLLAGLPSGYFLDVTKRRKPLLVLGSLMAVMGVGINAFATSPFMLIATFFLFGLANVVSYTALQAYFSDVGGPKSSLILGTYLAVLWIGGMFSPPLSGWIAERYGLRTIFVIEFFAGVAITAFLAIIFKEKARTFLNE